MRAEGRDCRAGYDLSLNRYKEVEHEEVEHVPPKQIIAELKALEEEIQQGLRELGGDALMSELARRRLETVATSIPAASTPNAA